MLKNQKQLNYYQKLSSSVIFYNLIGVFSFVTSLCFVLIINTYLLLEKARNWGMPNRFLALQKNQSLL